MKVIVYTMDGCPHCDNLKKILKENKITFTEKNVDKYEKEYEKFSKIVESEYLPAILVGKRAFIPEKSFKTISQAGTLIESYLLEQSNRGNHLG